MIRPVYEFQLADFARVRSNGFMKSLESPGSGLPSLERVLLGTGLKIGSAFLSDQRALKMFVNEAEILFELMDATDFDFASRQVLIPRYQGMEDSSRNWSMFMVLEHLCRVDREIMRIIDVLRSGVNPLGEIDIADYKPDIDTGSEVIEQFRSVVTEYTQSIQRLTPLRNTSRFSHPWFGPLDAHGWHCLAAVHHRIHRKQARKIAAMLGQV